MSIDAFSALAAGWDEVLHKDTGAHIDGALANDFCTEAEGFTFAFGPPKHDANGDLVDSVFYSEPLYITHDCDYCLTPQTDTKCTNCGAYHREGKR